MTKATFIALILISLVFLHCESGKKTSNAIDNSEVASPSNSEFKDKPVSFVHTTFDTIPNEKLVDLFYPGQLAHWVRDILRDKNNNLWLATNHYGAIRRNRDSVTYFTEDNGIGGSQVRAIVEDNLGNVWFGTSRGITKYDPNLTRGHKNYFSIYNENNGLSHDEVWSMFIDSNGLMWVGTENGLNVFDGKNFRKIDLPKSKVTSPNPSISDQRITSIAQDKSGAIWFGVDGNGLYKLADEKLDQYSVLDGLPDNSIMEVMVDSNNVLWIGTMYGGLSSYDGKSFNNYTKEGKIKGIEVGGLFEASNGDIWFAAEHQGVFKYDGKKFINYNETYGLKTGGVISIYEDVNGDMLFGGWKGLFKFNKDTIVAVTKNSIR